MPSILPPERPTQLDPLDLLVYPFEATFWHRQEVRELDPSVVYVGPLPQSSSFVHQIVASLPYPGYVYVIQDDEGDVLYVGKTINPVGRLSSHRAKKGWWPRCGRLTLLGVEAPDEALSHARSFRLEAIAIRDLEPRYNIAGMR